MDAPTTTDARRSSIEKPPISPPPFDRLPDEIIEQILQDADANGFASLVLLNRKWRTVSQRAHLYIHHLAQCPSLAASHAALPAADDDNLPQLRRIYAKEVKRNLFQAYLRPNETLVKLVSNSIGSSSAPGGEGFQFNASPKGHHILAFNSARVYVIDVRGQNIDVKRELKILRRPSSACIDDGGTLLAVLSTEMQVDLYDLQQSPPRRTRSMILDNTPRTIAISPCGSVLAAAYEGGIEVTSLRSGASEAERRSVKCDAVDALAFSFDGTQILGSTTHSASPSTVIITAPYYDPGAQMMDDNLSPLWTTSILFPNTSRDCSHAVLLQDGSHEEAAWALTYDRSFETFRAVRIDDLRNGTTHFTGPVPLSASQAKLLPSTLPSASYHGDLMSAGFQGKDIWIYGVPEDLVAVPESTSTSVDSGSSTSLGRENSGRSGLSRRTSNRAQDNNGNRVPQWQLLCDRLRNTFIEGSKVTELPGVTNVKWVGGFGNSSSQERLIITARGISATRLPTDEEDMDFVDGGRIKLVDFDYGLVDGTKTEITIEVGTDNAEVLDEEQRDMAADVAIVRRRTQRRGGGHSALLRAATSAASSSRLPPVPSLPAQEEHTDDDPLVPRVLNQNPASRSTTHLDTVDDEDVASIDEMEALDAPYSHTSPRPTTTLRRAATAAARDRSLHPRTADGRRIEYRRADGRREHPHESDADNWVPPPPPYQKDDPGDLPAFLRGPSVAPPGQALAAAPPVPPLPSVPSEEEPSSESKGNEHSASSSQQPRVSERTSSDSLSMARPRPEQVSAWQSAQRNGRTDGDADLYDVTPPDSPRLPNDEQMRTITPPRAPSAISSSHPTPARSFTAPITSMAFVSPPPVQRESDSPLYVASDSEPPILSLRMPSTDLSGMFDTTETSTPRQLPNTRTWPAAYTQSAHPAVSAGYSSFQSPTSAGPQSQSAHPAVPSAPSGFPTFQTSGGNEDGFPPLPSSGQLASLDRRVNHGNPRRLSDNFNIQRRPVGTSSSGRSFPHVQSNPSSSGSMSSPHRSPVPEIDQPLIISTPTGVIGAFDSPNRHASQHRGGTPLLAPIPRHPRPTPTSITRPTVERLETIYSTHTAQPEDAHAMPPSTPHRGIPAWLQPPPVPQSRTSPGVTRKPSRAERSAAKNIKDAKQRGWKNKKKRKKDKDAASSAGWTDVSVHSTGEKAHRDKKCVVM